MEAKAQTSPRVAPAVLGAVALLALTGAGPGFLQAAPAPPPAGAPRLAALPAASSLAAAAELRAAPALAGGQAGGSAWRAGAAALAMGLLLAVRRSPDVVCRVRGNQPVRQWAPEPIPPSARRAPEDRIRIKMKAHHPLNLMEAVECFEELARETGGETEGPVVQRKKKLLMTINRSPNGHKKSKFHYTIEEHAWILDYYPPVDGGLDAIMRLRLPHTVAIDIL